MASPHVEPLEPRRLLSVAAPSAGVRPSSLSRLKPPSPITLTSTVLTGTTINAETNHAFRAVVGTIQGLGSLPSWYTIRGDINWGDGTPSSDAQFVWQSDGSIAVLGAHTYANAGVDDIRVTILAVPPPWSLAPVRLIGTFHSKANVIASNGGVTLEQTAGQPFTANLAFFHSTASASTLSALIDWGDGTQSAGKIIELPTAGPIPTYAVVGSHTYSSTGSYLAHVTVYSSQPPPTAGPSGPAGPATVIAQIDSVIDVLPPLPTASAVDPLT